MSNNPFFSVQILKKIGAPLMEAINDVSSGDEASETEAAQIMAQLLSQSVAMGTALYNTLQVNEDDNQADSTRLALTALASPFVAEFYKKRQQIPTEENIKRMSKSFESLISFGENFTPTDDNISRLQTIEHDVVFFDKNQPILLTLQAMVPVINAVEEFSFGQSRQKLVQDIAGKLQNYTADIMGEINVKDKLQELIIFKSLAEIYTNCHRNETMRASSGNNSERGELSMDPIWQAFETKLEMVKIVMGLVGTETVVPQSSTVKPDVSAQKPSEEKSAPPSNTAGPMGFFKKEPEVKAAPATPASTPTNTAPNTQSTNANPSSPMGFFKPDAKKKSDGENT